MKSSERHATLRKNVNTAVSAIATVIILCLAVPSFSGLEVHGRKIKTTPPKAYSKNKKETEQPQYEQGSFMVASECTDCNNGYRIDQIKYSGYDKTKASNYETFFVTNLTDSEMTAFSLYIEYLSTDGRQFHKRFVKETCSIPAGETRKFDIKSWDRQHSFHYFESADSRKPTTPYKVRFIPVAYWLQFKAES